MINREVFYKDPLETTIPNDGVAKIHEPETPEDWEVLRHELSTFVCEGEYKRGLEVILDTYLKNLGKPTQPAAWVSGFYGSGKSHLVRVLEFLWRDVTFPGGATARGLADLPDDINDLLRELSTAGRREGGLWSAAGTLGAGAGDSVRLAILNIVFESAGLYRNYAQGRFELWLRQSGLYERVKAGVEAAGKDYRGELEHLYVSPYIARSLLEVYPDLAASEREARALLKAQYPAPQDISDEEMLSTMAGVFALRSNSAGRIPCTLLVLDELQQYLGDNADRTLRVQNVVEAISARFAGRLLLVATGQSALQATQQLQKLQGRFTVRVSLSDTDVEEVVRKVVLRKAPDKRDDLDRLLEETRGEIDRQLGGTKIAPNREDEGVLVADYPLLPVRRRFWERVLRATDRAGSNSQLRAQLRIVLRTVQEIADDPLGRVVTGDALYEHIAPDMIQTGVLPRQVDETIRKQRDGTEEGDLRSRLCALVFLIGQLPTEAGGDTGVHPTVDALADLMVEDLKAGGSSLRQRIPELLEGMVERGDLMRVDGEYRLQTREGAEWNLDYHSAYARILGDDARIAGDRDRELRQAATEALKGTPLVQGESKTPRKIDLHFAADAPPTNTGAVPVWIRDEWSVSEKTAREDARAAGPEDPVVHVFLHRRNADALKRAIASYEAATEVLQGRPTPTTNEGVEARAAIESRQRGARFTLDATVDAVLRNARVLQGGGAEVAEGPLKPTVRAAAEASLHRLYPRFEAGDNPRWELAFKRAREGNTGDPLEAVGYSGDAEKHPVCAGIVSYVGAAGKQGREVRTEFGSPPYGWPPDTINGALVVLLAAGVLRAEINGQPVGAKDVDRTKIGATAFRSETVVLTRSQTIRVRKLLTEADPQVRSGQEVRVAGEFLRMMEDLANSAGGAAPLPAPPDKAYLQGFRSLGGNELLVALYEADDRLRGYMAAWREAAKKARDRLSRWERLRRLLDHARPLPASAALREQADAVHEGRALLDEPDPVPPLLSEVADVLREAVSDTHRRYSEAFDAGVQRLEVSSAWRSLAEQEQDRILRVNNLLRKDEPRLGNDAAVLDSLNVTSLSEWEDMIDALPERFARALVEATEKVEPKTVRVKAPSASLKTVNEVDDYLEGLRAEIMQHIEEGRPVIL